MLFRVKQTDDSRYPYSVSYDSGEFGAYALAISEISDKVYDTENKCWQITEEALKFLRKYETESHEDLLYYPREDVESSIKGWEDIGASLKLKPYDYQKQIIKYVLDHEKVLVTASCGAGKSCCLLGIFSELRVQRVISGPMIVIVRASLKEQWLREVAKFTDYTAVIIKTLAQLNKDEDRFSAQFKGSDIYICNYESLLNDDIKKRLLKLKPDIVAADECQAVKDDTTKRSKALRAFSKVRFTIGMTATPVQKNPMDIFAIFKFVNPELFPKKVEFGNRYVQWQSFGQWIKKPIGSKNEKELRQKLKNNMIIKTKEEISSQLPTLIAVKKYCKFSDRQQKKAEKLQQKIEELHQDEHSEMSRLAKAGAAESPKLKQIGSDILMYQTFAQELTVDEELLKMSDAKNAVLYTTGDKSPKTELCLELLEEILSAGEKVAIFSRFTRYQDILKREIWKAFKAVGIAQINGAMTSLQRQKQLDRFRQEEDCKILLMSGAANEGINLSECGYLIEMEFAQSFAEQTQRHGRIERADSTHKTVYVYQLIVENSWDEIAEKIVDKKEGYDRTIIKGEET